MVDPDYATIDQKIVAAWTTAHEWFGDLVTFSWFNDLFLNEAFAQYFMWNVLNYTDTRTRSYIDDYIRAHYNIWSIGDDCGRDSKPLRSDTPPLFSYAPYDKGPALLHMIEQTLSWRVFIDGLTNYIQNHLYGNADAYDLWKSLTDEAQSRSVLGWDGKPLNVTDFMEEWSNKVSYPTIIMSQQSGNIAFQQSSCLQQSPPVSWKIPLWVQNSGNEDMNWFYGDSGTNSAWTYPIPTSGFKVINSRVVVSCEKNNSKYSLTHFMFPFDTGDYTWQDWLDLTMYMGSEQEFGPFEVVMDYWNELLSRFRYDSNFPTIVKYINSVSTYAMQNMQWCDSCTNEWKQMVFSRYITSLSCRMGNSACLNEATNRFFAFKRNCTDFNAGTSTCNPIIPDFRRYAYCYGASSEPQNAAPFLYKHMNYFQTKAIYFNRDFDNLLFALSCVNDYDAMKP
ncbi:hypothetical protein WR25_27125 [Diploscapter pachys]|uniref:Peptidase M1 membrane alanine aminopeptidase domain-containing protein n=1 Tax=Diploscapter pachys TaxID=2018661 RepID=A0A2A2LLT0_9BILA|nr:hypothetical protein WR25_27125 [Diploscapter pachys]